MGDEVILGQFNDLILCNVNAICIFCIFNTMKNTSNSIPYNWRYYKKPVNLRLVCKKLWKLRNVNQCKDVNEIIARYIFPYFYQRAFNSKEFFCKPWSPTNFRMGQQIYMWTYQIYSYSCFTNDVW